jgi:hypothetical protein
MAFPDDLLQLAQHLADLHPESPHQASLRRAVSTAYYAIFHFLITEATSNWARKELRAKLGRCFDHGTMKSASETKVGQINTALKRGALAGEDKMVAIHIRTVANAFVQAQQRRNDADYKMDTEKDWTPVEVATHVASVTEAFRIWNIVREESEAQAYLVSLLGTRERRTSEPQAAGADNQRKQRDPGTPRATEGQH